MAGQNIIDIGYDIDKLTLQQKVIVDFFTTTLTLIEQIDGRKIAPDIKGIQDYTAANNKVKAGTDEIALSTQQYNKILSELAVSQAKQNALSSTAATDLAKQKASLQATNTELSANAKLNNAAAGSIEQAVAQVKSLTIERNKLNLTTAEGKARQADINKEIDSNNAFIQTNVSGLEKQKINVGNYSGALQGYANTLRGLRGPTKLLAEAFGMSAMEADQFRLVLEHSLQGLAAFFRGKEKTAAATTESTVATEAASIATAENTVVSEASTVAKGTEAVALEATTVALEGEAVAAEAAEVATGGLFALLLPFIAAIAIAAIPIFLLVDAVKSWANADKNAALAEKNLAESLEKSILLEKEAVETIKAKNEAQVKGYKDEIALATKAGASKETLLAAEQKLTKQELENATKIKDSKGVTAQVVAKSLKDEQNALLNQTGIQRRINEVNRIEELTATMTFIEKNLFLKKNGYVIENQDKLKAQLETADASYKLSKSTYDFQKGILDDFSKAQQSAAENGIDISRTENEEENKLTLQRLTDKEEISKAKNGIILADEKANLNQKLTALKENNNAEKKVLEEGLRQRLTDPSARGSDGNYTKETLAEIAKVNTQKQVLNINYLDSDRKMKLSFHVRDLEALKLYNETLLNETIESNKRIISSNVFSLEERTASLTDNSAKQTEIINNEYQRQLELKGFVGNKLKTLDKTQKDELSAMEVEHNTKLRNLALQQESDLITIQLSELDKLKKDADNYYKDSEKSAELANAAETFTTVQKYSSAKKLLNDKLVTGQIGITKYNTEVKELERNAGEQSLRDAQVLVEAHIDIEEKARQSNIEQITAYNEKIAALEAKKKGKGLDTDEKKELDSLNNRLRLETDAQKDHETKIFNLKAQYLKNGQKLSDDEANKIISNQAKIKQATQQLVTESINLIKTLIDSGYEQQLNALQKVKDRTDENYATELKNIQGSTLSQQDKAAKTIQLEAEQKARDKQIEREQKEIKNRQAKADRAFAVAGIIESTSIAVVGALGSLPFTPANLGLAALVGAIGAVQLATVLAKPIPQYAEGIDSHPGGLAIVGEGKYKENVTLPSGDSFIADKAMLLNLPKGTNVAPITDSVDIAMQAAMFGKTARMFGNMDSNEQRKNSNIAGLLVKNNALLEKIAGKSTSVKTTNKITVDYGFTSYINQQVFGR